MIEKLTINDICEFVGGSQPEKSEFVYEPRDGYIRLIQTRDYKTDNFMTYIPIEAAKKRCTSTDIIIGRYGPPIFQIFRGLEGAYNVALMKAVPKSNVLNDYLYYFLKQDRIFRYVDALSARTGGQTGVDLDSLKKYPVLLPDKEYQQKVVDVLSGIDKLITNNQKQCDAIDRMCLMLFEHWFLQFDFPDKQGKPYKSSGGKMDDSKELGRKIPESWSVGNIESLGSIVAGGTPATEKDEYYTDDGIAWITPNDLSEQTDCMFISHGERDITQEALDNSSAVLMPAGSVLFSSRAPIGYLAISEESVSTNQGFKSIVPDKGYGKYFVYYLLKKYKDVIAGQGAGTTFKEVSKDTFAAIKICLPPKDLVNTYESVVEEYCGVRMNCERENRKLCEYRDYILPMLMTGQIKVS